MPYRVLDLDTYTITPCASLAVALDLAKYARAFQIWKGRGLLMQVGA